MAIDKKYLEEAKQMLSGQFNNNRVQLNNSFAQNVQGLEGQKAGVNQNFDNQLEQNSRNVITSQNQYNNNTLARGLGRSTIATSGQAGIKDSGNRIANQVNQGRTDALGQIEAQKVQLQQALQENLLGITSKEESEALSLAQQLEGIAYERDWQSQQFGYQKEQDKWANDFKMSQFEYQKQQDALARQLQASRSGSGGGGGSSSGGGTGSNFNATQAWRYYDSLLAKDKANGTYEAGRFAQQVAKISPQDSQAMILAYNQMRKKSGSVPKQTSTNKNTGKTYTNY